MISTSGSGRLLHPVGQFEQSVFVFLGVEVRLQRRRGRAQHHHCIRHLGPHHRHVARVIARHLFLLIRRILLLVHDHQRQIGDRREHRRARAHHHASVPALDAMPLLGALLVGQAPSAGSQLRLRRVDAGQPRPPESARSQGPAGWPNAQPQAPTASLRDKSPSCPIP